MSQTQYKTLMSNLLKQKHSLAKLRKELEEKEEKLCQYCKKFGHLACNCRNVKEEREKAIPLNKFEILSSRVIQSGDKGRTIRRIEAVVVECYKCGEKEHKCRECVKTLNLIVEYAFQLEAYI